MVASFFRLPGGVLRNFPGDSMTWSIERPSSRVCMRIVWTPDEVNVMFGPNTLTPYPLSCHPHPDTPHPEQSSRFISAAAVVPVRLAVESENWTNTESFA